MSAVEPRPTPARPVVGTDLKSVTNAVPALISFFDVGLVCRFANDFHNEWFGRSPESLVGQHIRDFLGPEAYATRAPYIERVVRGELVSFDAKVPYRDGGERYAAVSYVPRIGPDGYEGFYVLVFDMARRKQEIAGMLDLAHDAICLKKLDGTVTFWNAGCEEAYGWGRQEVVGQRMNELLKCCFPEGPLDEIEQRLLKDGRWGGEIIRKHRDGSERIIAARLSLRKDVAGNPIEMLEMGRDITAARRAEEELKRSELRYRNVFGAMAVSFFEIDLTEIDAMLDEIRASGVTDLRAHFAANPGLTRAAMERAKVTDVNEKTVQLFGGTHADHLGNVVSRYWPMSSEAIFAESIFAPMEGKSHYEADTRLLTLDGREIDVHFTVCYPAEGEGNHMGLVGLLDISERVRAQNEIAHVQAELAHAARVSTLGELSASIAHEVNQPLTATVTNAEASLRWLALDEPDIDEARAAIGRAITQAKRASDIIQRIRAMSTKRAPEKTRFLSRSLVDDAVAILRRELADQKVRLRLNLANGLPEIEGDRVQLQQVVINLMVNAIQALAQAAQGERMITLRLLSDEDRIALDVEDNGPGVPPEHAARLFNAFFTTKQDGMGMGLSICKSIVEAHGGTITLLPAEPQGALFRVTLPASAQLAAAE